MVHLHIQISNYCCNNGTVTCLLLVFYSQEESTLCLDTLLEQWNIILLCVKQFKRSAYNVAYLTNHVHSGKFWSCDIVCQAHEVSQGRDFPQLFSRANIASSVPSYLLKISLLS